MAKRRRQRNEALRARATGRTPLPLRKRAPVRPRLGIRGFMATIVHAARNLRMIRVRYHKVTTGEIVTRVLEPYSFRFRRLSIGRARVLFGYHRAHKSIEMYVTKRIQWVELTNRRYSPRWKVEIGV